MVMQPGAAASKVEPWRLAVGQLSQEQIVAAAFVVPISVFVLAELVATNDPAAAQMFFDRRLPRMGGDPGGDQTPDRRNDARALHRYGG